MVRKYIRIYSGSWCDVRRQFFSRKLLEKNKIKIEGGKLVSSAWSKPVFAGDNGGCWNIAEKLIKDGARTLKANLRERLEN